MSEKNSISIKLVALGDSGVGKHEILLSYIKDQLTQDFVPQVFDNFTIQIAFEGKNVNLSLWDTAGQEKYNKLRQLNYGMADIFLIIFSVIDQESFQSAITKWYQDLETPEFKQVPKIFVGNNKEMRNQANPNHVQYEALNLKQINYNISIWNVRHKHKKVLKRFLTQQLEMQLKAKDSILRMPQVKIKKMIEKKSAQYFEFIYVSIQQFKLIFIIFSTSDHFQCIIQTYQKQTVIFPLQSIAAGFDSEYLQTLTLD
ncbi:unnamed protein product [Paramecium octaurelia]|uniref:Uncharacterized protein n=1 Tax=Paramecium octaurelia TaxID=43137 RepID=A0A8S1YJA0_PAROT|nr:unnamed protein product [Paramecium octaurelia]